MPVRDLTDTLRRVPRLGKIRLGDRSGTNGAPVNKPFFVCPEEVQAIYGREPTELRIVFLSDDEEVIASSYYRAYNASNGLVCRGTGFNAQAKLDEDEIRKRHGDITQPLPLDAWAHGNTAGRAGATRHVIDQFINCPGAGYENHAACPMFASKKCAVRTFFQFAIYGVPGLGVYQMDTGSVVNVQRILGVLEICKTLMGGVAGVPMILSRVKTDVAPDGIKKSVWTVDLKVDTQYSLTEVLKLRAGPMANALLPPVDESEVYDDIEDDAPALPAPHEAAQQAPQTGDQRGTSAATPTAPRSADAPVPAATSPACEHEAYFDENTTLMTCNKCGVVIEEAPADAPKQRAMV